MSFESRSFWHPKSLECSHEYEDAFAVGERGVAAMSDGVSSAIFSRQWAQLLTNAVAEQPPDLSDPVGFQTWLGGLRNRWRQSIDLSQLSWNQKQKLQQAGGAYATLIWAEFYPVDPSLPDVNCDFVPASKLRMRCFAVGDSCLFHVRGGQVLHKFPLDSAAEFEGDPISICSVNRNRDHLLAFECLDDFCHEGDFVFLATDALAKWIYERLEAEEPVGWDWFWNMTEAAWYQWVAELRELPAGQRMRIDDTTLTMLRMVAQPQAVSPETAEPLVEALLPVLSGSLAEVSDNQLPDAAPDAAEEAADGGGREGDDGTEGQGGSAGEETQVAEVVSCPTACAAPAPLAELAPVEGPPPRPCC